MGASGDGISDLIIEALKNLLTPSAMGGHSKRMATYEPGSGPSSDRKYANELILDFPTSSTVRSKLFFGLFVCFISNPIYGIFVLASQRN